VNDKADLLKQLKIDRNGEIEESGPHKKWWIAGVVLAVAGALLYFLLKPAGIPVSVAIARQVSGASATTGTSILDASGYVVARRQATVSAKITGKVTDVLIEEGQHVEKDAVVGRLDDTNIRAALNQARAQLDYSEAARAQVGVNLANAEREWARRNDLFRQHFVSQEDVDNARTARDALRAELATAQRSVDLARRGVESAQRNLDDTVVRAPFSGVVTVKAAQPGEMVSPISAGGGFTRTGIGTIVDMDSLEVDVDVNENFIARVRPGQPVSVRLNAYPDWQIPAHVIAIIPAADRAKATVKVRIGLETRDPRILPDMGVRVSFLGAPEPASGAASPGGVEVPVGAVLAQGSSGVVYVIQGDRVARRAVRLGVTGSGGQLVLSGLDAGERVATGDLNKLADGVKIREK